MPPGVGGDGVCGAGAGFGARFLAFALLADFALFVPFFVRAEVRRFAFLSFFAMFNLQINQSIMPTRHQTAVRLPNLYTTFVIASLGITLVSRTIPLRQAFANADLQWSI
jgi:hypothetical protein